MTFNDTRPDAIQLLTNLRAALPELDALKAQCDEHWGAEDSVYRFYHRSFKVYGLQSLTKKIVVSLQQLLPDRELNTDFLYIMSEGTEKQFSMDHNRRWLIETRPIVEAFFHARFFLDMACKYGREMYVPPTLLPSGWAALLYLYNLR